LILHSLFSDEGKSYAFDERGSGFGRGEGVGCIVLKPLDQAIKDGDAIRAVIHGTGINQDGRTKGITMPSGEAQEALMKSVYAKAGLDPTEVGYGMYFPFNGSFPCSRRRTQCCRRICIVLSYTFVFITY
jgi:acyl transferase domain-containing protein